MPGLIRDQFGNIGNNRILVQGKPVQVHYALDRMWGAALTLILLVMVLNLIARLIARRSKVSS